MKKTLLSFVERITFRNEEGFSVIKLKVPKQEEFVTATGALSSVQIGEEDFSRGFWRNHPK